MFLGKEMLLEQAKINSGVPPESPFIKPLKKRVISQCGFDNLPSVGNGTLMELNWKHDKTENIHYPNRFQWVKMQH